MQNSRHSTWTLAHVSKPVNPTAKRLSGSGFNSRSFQLRLNLGSPSSFFKSSPAPSLPFNPLPFSANPTTLVRFLGFWVWVLMNVQVCLDGLFMSRMGRSPAIDGIGTFRMPVPANPNIFSQLERRRSIQAKALTLSLSLEVSPFDKAMYGKWEGRGYC